MDSIPLTKSQLEVFETIERIQAKLRRLRRRYLDGIELEAFIRRSQRRQIRRKAVR